MSGLYLGNVQSAGNKGIIMGKKIGAVLSIMNGCTLKYPQDLINHKVIPLEDDFNTSIIDYFEEGYTFIEENLKKTNVLVHCIAGISRSGSIIIAYLMKKYNYSY